MANTTPQNPPVTPVKQIIFAFPFRKKRQGTNSASTDFIDEHEFHKLLKLEPSGAYSVSGKSMWHGGIHVTEAGAGASLDLKNGVRCIADGEVVAWRVNRTYPVSEIPAQNGNPAISAPYSTGFALVRHSMEFPKDQKLTFYSLYMHLQDFADYQGDTSQPWPKYWSTRFEVTAYAQDPAGAGGAQQGLRVRVSKPHGTVLAVLAQGAQVSIGKREGDWGQIKDASGAALYPGPAGGSVQPSAVANGWIFLGEEHGGFVAKEVMPDSSLDQVVVVSTPSEVVPIKAGELIGHLGRYDSLSQQNSGNRMVHIEVFCDDSVKSFIEQGRTWISQNGAHVNAWQQLKLPSEPTILRIERQTTLYGQPNKEGADASQTGVIELFAFAALQKAGTDHQYTETEAGNDGEKRHWWKVDSADVSHQPIDGWVREQSFAGGMVTREFAQKWVDFQPLDDPHDPTHTMFGTTAEFVDYATGAEVPNPGSLDKLSPLMSSIYQALQLAGDSSKAADELCNAANDPWTALRMSRLIIQHESEWANPDKWEPLIAAIEARTGPKPEHAEEQNRIQKLVWWDTVKAGVPDFPESDVFHIHPIALVGNFQKLDSCDCGCCLENDFKVTRWNGQTVHYGPLYKGSLSLENSPAMRRLLDSGRMTEREHRLLAAMSQNEGNVDGVQAYDSEIFTAGACQKTVNPAGAGEFPVQVAQFKADNEAAYQRLFARCGWTVETDGDTKMYYRDSEITAGVKITGDQLLAKLREGCTEATFGHRIKQKPLAVIAHAIVDDEFQDKQVKDFVLRLQLTRTLVPVGYTHSIAEYFMTDLGHATALDQHVNRPNNVVIDVGKALDVFFHAHSTVQRDPATWGESHAAYESEILAYYGEHRHMNDCHSRFAHLRSRLS